MNILISINSGYALCAAVMLTSLIKNSNNKLDVYCLFSELDESSVNLITEVVQRRANSNIYFLHVDEEKCKQFKKFPTTDLLKMECYYILLAHEMLPKTMERILYLDSDIIVNDDLSELYDTDFEDKYIVVAGQSYKKIKGNYYPIGSRPEYGDCFNSGVILFNLPKMRQDITMQTYNEFASKVGYKFYLADQGILNLVFYNRAKYIDTMRYNFRMSIYRDYLEDGTVELEINPAIIHYANHDFYRIGYGTKPWICTFTEPEYTLLEAMGKVKKNYGMDEWVKMNRKIHSIFWEYAHTSGVYEKLFKRMINSKKSILVNLIGGYKTSLMEVIERQVEEQEIFTHLLNGEFYKVESNLNKYTYGELEKYIDALSPTDAKKTLVNLHTIASRKISEKKEITVGFLVYSSAEWQCDRLYWMLEKDERFTPIIIICGYGHGTSETIKDTYKKTCRYFLSSGKEYHIRYGGYLDNMYKDSAKDVDIIVYLAPYNNICPNNLNFINRYINQLGVHIPYGFYQEEKNIPYYGKGFYESPIFKMGLAYFAESKIQCDEVTREQRLGGYNIIVSGLPKMDAFMEESNDYFYGDSQGVWKMRENTRLKVIWAPHFNMQSGMNGTFHENYYWFFEYAKNHGDISWIVRPHPRMAVGAMEKGLFSTLFEYEDYLAMWNELPNARVAEFGDYCDIFNSSDCMILDSLSFISEYQYTGKPLLRLLPEKIRPMNEFGMQLNEVVYKCRGNDFLYIEKFIEKMIKKDDPMVSKRRDFFINNLDYRRINGCLASEKIYETLTKYFARQ